MNSILVNGSTKKKRQLVQDAVQWYIKNYMPRFRTLNITVDIKKLEDGYFGFCDHIDRNEFTIEVARDCSIEEMIQTVMHEMIHVKQFARKELTECLRTGRQKWKSKWFSYDTDYDDMPWEKEAHRYDEKFANEFLTQLEK